MTELRRTLESASDAGGAADLPAVPQPSLHISPAPHLSNTSLTIRRMMLDVLIGLAPVVGMAVYVFGWYAVQQVGLATLACLAAEAAFVKWRGRTITLNDLSAGVTGVILGLSIPWSAPWYVPVLGGVFAIGLGKIVFGGLGQNIFNPAMVGRAFVMLAFPAALGASAFIAPDVPILSEATPLTAAKQEAVATALWPMFLGTVNGSLGETSVLASLIGGLYIVLRRTASWEIPVSVLGSVAVCAGIGQLLAGPDYALTLGHHLFGGALVFGAFFIATDPCSSPLTPKGKAIFGAGVGVLIYILRTFSGYPEGLMFAILLMNACAPLINRWTVPTPLGGPVPAKK